MEVPEIMDNERTRAVRDPPDWTLYKYAKKYLKKGM